MAMTVPAANANAAAAGAAAGGPGSTQNNALVVSKKCSAHAWLP